MDLRDWLYYKWLELRFRHSALPLSFSMWKVLAFAAGSLAIIAAMSWSAPPL